MITSRSLQALIVACATLALIVCMCPAFAASSSGSVLQVSDEEQAPHSVADIQGPQDVMAGHTIVLDASDSKVVGSDAQYEWYVNDAKNPISRSVDLLYTPDREGEIRFRLVLRTTVNGKTMESQSVHTVTVYHRKIFLVVDPSVPNDQLPPLLQAAASADTYLKIVRPAGPVLSRGGQEQLTALLEQHVDDLMSGSPVLLWADPVSSLQSLMDVAASEKKLDLSMQTIGIVTDANFRMLARTVGGPFQVLRVRQILLLHPKDIGVLVQSPNVSAFLAQSQEQGLNVQLINAQSTHVRPWNLLSLLVNYMLAHGVSSQTVILLLVLPVIATILSFLRQVIGMSTFGLFTPSIVALSFLALGWQVGVLFLLFIVITGYAVRAVVNTWHLLYIPKMAIILAVSSVTLLLLVGMGATFGLVLSRDTVFILLIMSTLSESFLNAKTEQGWRSAVFGIGQTILASLLCVFLVQWPLVQSLLLAYPELLILVIIINVFLGRWTGLRLIEYFRFRDVFHHLSEE